MFFSFHCAEAGKNWETPNGGSDAGVPFFFPAVFQRRRGIQPLFFKPCRRRVLLRIGTANQLHFRLFHLHVKTAFRIKYFVIPPPRERPGGEPPGSDGSIAAAVIAGNVGILSYHCIRESGILRTFTAAPISSAAQSVTATAPASSAKQPTCSSFPAGTSLRYPSVTCYAPSGTSVKKQTPFVYMKIF